MFGQTFQVGDIATMLALVLLEGLLSADNALVLAILVKHLPTEERKKALLYGLAGAFVFRLLAIIFALVVLKQWWLQAVGALYLLYVPLKHWFFSKGDEHHVNVQKKSFWSTVIAVELTDIAFAIDSVLAGVAFVNGKQEKTWVVFFGAVIGIVLLRFAASFFVRLLERYPFLDNMAYALVFWVGVKLAFLAGHTFSKVNPERGMNIPEMPLHVFWGILAIIVLIGVLIARLRQEEVPADVEQSMREHEAATEEIFEDFLDGEEDEKARTEG